jgi:glycosyltransferase involved in cell wall biosynthesis
MGNTIAGARIGSPAIEESVRSMSVVGTYMPRRCGIATFTADLTQALILAAPEARVRALALNDRVTGYAYPSEVEFEIDESKLRDYHLAADYLNMNRTRVVSIQHEFGIYGGQDGSHILKFMSKLRMPIVTTLHTVLRRPTESQRRVVGELAALSDRLVVMSQNGHDFLVEVYGIDDAKIEIIPHGIPDTPFIDPNYYKEQFGVAGKKVLLSFGLLSPNKGYEYMIRALPAIAERHPDVVYLILGATHPNVFKQSGESYRFELQKMSRDLHLDDRVIFHDRYVDIAELCEFLGTSDIYVTPYISVEQITSGTLAYAMGAGKPVVSTPFWHAEEMLADGRGRLVPARDSHALASTIIDLLDHEAIRHSIRRAAYLYSRSSIWSESALRYIDLFRRVVEERRTDPRPVVERSIVAKQIEPLPEVDLTHLRRITDDTGLLQHATSFMPNRAHGYCTDDNARALIVAIRARSHVTDVDTVDSLILCYLAFLQHAFDAKLGAFRNLMSYDRQWEGKGSPDSQGRAIWSLGVAAVELGDERLRSIAARLLHGAFAVAGELTDLRSMAFALIGLDSYVESYGGERQARLIRNHLAGRLQSAFQGSAGSSDWPWPEQRLSYANARLPHGLLVAARALGNQDLLDIALNSLRWLVETQTIGGYFAPVGNRGWYQRGGARARFDQQPIEADATFAACVAAHQATQDHFWIEETTRVFRWFLGHNDLGAPLYDHATGGCCDGLHAEGVSENQGAESTLAWLSVLLQAHDLLGDEVIGWTSERATEVKVRPRISERSAESMG